MMRKSIIVLGYAVAVWAFCGALIGLGRQVWSIETTLVVHAVGAPIGAAALSWRYFRNHGFASPPATGAIFVATALVLDFFVVALAIERSLGMFASVLGVWIPQALIFMATYLVGRLTRPSTPPPAEEPET